ncbi:dihydrodipicolinate synthase family protein [Nonomuraea sp. NPDC046570]|uniref:dihydrodipicolinate synthase family protein n=1 Tax=Nonomuraea sp. NPDC046570 TaxID=3155255 RepID=UPI0033C3A56A
MSRPTGIICPLVTPLTDAEELDEEAALRQLDRVTGRVDGLMVLGTTGELALLRESVANRLTEVVLDRADPALTVTLGIGDTGTARALRHLGRATGRVDFVSACSPYYYPVPESALIRHFETLAEASPVPLVLYNIPQNTHQPIPLSTVERLSGHGNIRGIKDSSGDIGYLKELLLLSGTDFSVLQGTDERNAERYFRMGVDGYVSGLENLVPGALRALAEALAAGADTDVPALARRVAGAARVTQHGFWLSALKAGVGMLVGGGHRPASPLPVPTGAELRQIRRCLFDLGLLDGAGK